MASCYLPIIMHLEGEHESKRAALKVLDIALVKDDLVLLKDLVRFLDLSPASASTSSVGSFSFFLYSGLCARNSHVLFMLFMLFFYFLFRVLFSCFFTCFTESLIWEGWRRVLPTRSFVIATCAKATAITIFEAVCEIWRDRWAATEDVALQREEQRCICA